MKTCFNHPAKKAFSICHNCRKDYCEECLNKGIKHYYCNNPECQAMLKKELDSDGLPINIICPNCKSELELSEDERTSKKVYCTECEALIDFNYVPPKILNKQNYVELLSSLNQGDISIIKSLLDSAEIDYYFLGENFLSAQPLLQPARLFVNENQIEEAKEILKDFDFNIWGISKNKYE